MTDTRTFLRILFDAAVAAASPAACMPLWLEDRPTGNVIVVGAGKAAASMAAIIEQQWAEPLHGLVIVPDGHTAECDHIEVVEASHPVPDERGVTATRRILDLVSNLSGDDTVVCLLSGGGSALLCAPASGITLDKKKNEDHRVTRERRTDLRNQPGTAGNVGGQRRQTGRGLLASACHYADNLGRAGQ